MSTSYRTQRSRGVANIRAVSAVSSICTPPGTTVKGQWLSTSSLTIRVRGNTSGDRRANVRLSAPCRFLVSEMVRCLIWMNYCWSSDIESVTKTNR